MKSVGGGGKITPIQLLNEGKVWLEIWENTSTEARSLLPATYCLFTALELHMKAYLVLKNSDYANIEKLKKLSHNFQHIYEKIILSGCNSLTLEINTQIKKYELQDIALDKLKYPENGRVWLLDHGLEKKEHTLNVIFQNIDSEVTTNHDQWLNTTYPKKTRIGAMTYIGYKGNPEEIDLKGLSNTCSECLPLKISIVENYDYPWNQELIPYRACTLCKKLFDPNGMRPSLSDTYLYS